MSVENIVSDYRIDTYSKEKLRRIESHHGELCPACWEIIELVLAGDIFMTKDIEEIKEEIEQIKDNMFNSYDVREIAEEAASKEVQEWIEKYDHQTKLLIETIETLANHISKKKTLNIRAEQDTTAQDIVKELKTIINFRKN